MKFYERYWQNKLPKMMFFSEHPIWSEEKIKQHENWIDTWSQGRMLDYGCGSGKFTNYINAIGTDISETAIKQATETYPTTLFYLPEELGDQKFDSIFLFDVMEHVFDFDELFEKLDKHTTKGIRLLITTSENCFIKMLAIGLLFIDDFFHPYSPHIRFFTRKNLKDLLESKGYRIIHYERVGNYLGFLSKGQFVVAQKEKNE